MREKAVIEAETYLTRADVARLLGVSPNTVTRWAREGRLPARSPWADTTVLSGR